MQPVRVVELAALAAATGCRVALRRALRGPLRPGWSLRTELAAMLMKAVLARSKRRGVHWLREAQALAPRSPLLREVSFTPVVAGGVPGEWCVPRDGPEPSRAVVYLHGGGYVIGSVSTHRDTLARIALTARARVLGVDYRLAPEHRFPAAQEDCLAATRAVIAKGVAARRLALAGDSAGGALAVATLLALRDAGEPLPAAAVLLCPWTDPLAEGGSMTANERFDFGDRELLVGWFDQFADRADARDPRVAPVYARLEGLPPLLVQAGGAEILLDQIRSFVERARRAGVDVRLDVHPDMVHDFQTQAAVLPEGARAIDDIARFLRERLPDGV